jgi:hypothetical protein
MTIQVKHSAVPVKILAKNIEPEPLGFVIGSTDKVVKKESKSDVQTPAQIWAEIIHEVAEEEREAEKNKYLKVRRLQKTEPKTHLTTNFSISGLKPENK